jgi:integrase
MSEARRRQAGEGGISQYDTKAGTRYRIDFRVEVDGEPKQITRRGFRTRKDAGKELRKALGKIDQTGEYVEPSKQPLGAYLDQWADGLRLAPSTVASYRKNIRLHLKPGLGAVPLANLTVARINALYRGLEQSGRVDHKAGQPLSARTVRYVHTILRAALQDAVNADLLVRNPARATPPTAKQARAPEMRAWSSDELRRFLVWSAVNSTVPAAWLVLAMTGVRRGELLALRWRDIDLDAHRLSVRRSAGLVKVDAGKRQVVEGPTKSGKPRMIDLDPATVAALRAHRLARAGLALVLAKDDALVFGTEEGRLRQPEHFSRDFTVVLGRCRNQLGDSAPPIIRLHDLRHTHATLLLQAGTPVKVVSERLGHATPTITLGVYAHVMPGMQRDAARAFADLVFGEQR